VSQQLIKLPDVGNGTALVSQRFTPAPGKRWRLNLVTLYVEASAAVLTRSIRLEFFAGSGFVAKFSSAATFAATEIAYLTLAPNAPAINTGSYRSGPLAEMPAIDGGYLDLIWDGDAADVVNTITLGIEYLD
jgi:hypothetical protein